jgi:hypothetical protein
MVKLNVKMVLMKLMLNVVGKSINTTTKNTVVAILRVNGNVLTDNVSLKRITVMVKVIAKMVVIIP